MARSTPKREDGFTLVELLDVILIIGILASIALASFLSQQSKAHDVNAKADARSAELAIEEWKQNHGTYDATPSELQTVDQNLVNAPFLSVSGATSSYSLTVRSSSANNSDFTITRASNGTVARTCTPTNKGGCPASGNW